MLGHALCAIKVEAEIVTIQRIVKDIGGIEGRIADQPVRIDGKPAALSPQDVFVVDVAMQRNGLVRRRQQLFCKRCGLRIDRRLICDCEKAGEVPVERLQV